METKDIPGLKKQYIELWKKVTRPGVDKFLEWLEKSDFYSAPCSTQFHLCVPGGLLQHSLHVYEQLQLQHMNWDVNISHAPLSWDSLVICGLGHDVCKVNFYKEDVRNVKENGVWVQKPYYKVEDKFPYGHGEKSVYILSEFFKLNVDEVMAIRWHMGGFTDGVSNYGMGQALSGAFNKYPLAVLLHLADMEASYLVEAETERK